MNDNVGVACLPAAGEILTHGTSCYISGWGNLYSNVTLSSSVILRLHWLLQITAGLICVEDDWVISAQRVSNNWTIYAFCHCWSETLIPRTILYFLHFHTVSPTLCFSCISISIWVTQLTIRFSKNTLCCLIIFSVVWVTFFGSPKRLPTWFSAHFLKVSVSPAGSVSRLALYFDSETEFVSSVDRIFFFRWIETSLKDVSNVTN